MKGEVFTVRSEAKNSGYSNYSLHISAIINQKTHLCGIITHKLKRAIRFSVPSVLRKRGNPVFSASSTLQKEATRFSTAFQCLQYFLIGASGMTPLKPNFIFFISTKAPPNSVKRDYSIVSPLCSRHPEMDLPPDPWCLGY